LKTFDNILNQIDEETDSLDDTGTFGRARAFAKILEKSIR
jgi:hypothetical protein